MGALSAGSLKRTGFRAAAPKPHVPQTVLARSLDLTQPTYVGFQAAATLFFNRGPYEGLAEGGRPSPALRQSPLARGGVAGGPCGATGEGVRFLPGSGSPGCASPKSVLGTCSPGGPWSSLGQHSGHSSLGQVCAEPAQVSAQPHGQRCGLLPPEVSLYSPRLKRVPPPTERKPTLSELLGWPWALSTITSAPRPSAACPRAAQIALCQPEPACAR